MGEPSRLNNEQRIYIPQLDFNQNSNVFLEFINFLSENIIL